jgi:hypothetical protein
MEIALYHPYMSVPTTDWLTRVVLYWDQVATIVPWSEQQNIAALGPHMAELHELELLTFVTPEATRSLDTFLEGWEQISGLLRTPTEPIRWANVHDDKLTSEVVYRLRERSLARDSLRGWPWYEIEQRTAGLYMAYLAGVVSGERNAGSHGQDQMWPVTDSVNRIAELGNPSSTFPERLRSLRFSTITEALPVPAGRVSFTELQQFKEDHSDDLIRLRHYLDGKLVGLSDLADNERRQVTMNALTAELRDQVATLSDQMKRNWPRVVLTGIGGVVAGGLSTASAVATGGTALAIGLAIAGGATALAGQSDTLAGMLRTPTYDRLGPLVYAALAARL